jgi:hypothetical protein
MSTTTKKEEIKGKFFSPNPGHNLHKLLCLHCHTYVEFPKIKLECTNRLDVTGPSAYDLDKEEEKQSRAFIHKYIISPLGNNPNYHGMRYVNPEKSMLNGRGQIECAGIYFNKAMEGLWVNCDKIRVCENCYNKYIV